MKSFLMFKDQDFDPEQPVPDHGDDLINDLELAVLLKAMAADDQLLFQASKTAILSSINDMETISFRQSIIKDCLMNPQTVRNIYRISVQAKENKAKRWMGIFSHSPSGVLSSAVKMMLMFTELLKALRKITDEEADNFTSEGFCNFFNLIKTELADDYLDKMDVHLKQLQFKAGAWIFAELGKGNEGNNYILRIPNKEERKWFKEIINLMKIKASQYSFTIDPRDQSGARALSDLQDQGLNQAANALAQSAEHIDAFFQNLRNELAFYIGCLNLYNQLDKINAPVTIPIIKPIKETKLSFHGLYDVCLALTMGENIVGNSITADDKEFFIITGANQGGKSTFLRSVGLAQLMLQAGMFVAAEDFEANLCKGIFSHFKRKEDATMKSGKLDEELDRMSTIVDLISPKAMLLLNESLSATNEGEGSEIARQITSAMLDHQIKIFYVTHNYELATSIQQNGSNRTLFLRAERKEDGTRTFKIKENNPQQTSFAEDVYAEVFDHNLQ
jgi:DNA mismatch repair ATPase MutS